MYNLNIIGIAVFMIGTLTGFILDVIHRTGGSEKIFTWFLLISSLISLVLFSKGTYKILLSFSPHLGEIILALLIFLSSLLQLLLCYVISFVIAVYLLAPLMGRLGYHVTMP